MYEMTCRLFNCGIDTKTSIVEYASNVFAILLRESVYWSQIALQNDDGIVKIESHGERRYLQLDLSLQNAWDREFQMMTLMKNEFHVVVIRLWRKLKSPPLKTGYLIFLRRKKLKEVVKFILNVLTILD